MLARLRNRIAVLILSALAGAGCTERTATEPELAAQFSSTGATLIECPSNTTKSVQGELGPLGGTLSLDGSSITLPAGAVLVPTTLTLTLPASNYMELHITANGGQHFQFEAPVTIAINYSRCTRSNINKNKLSAWYIDATTKALLQYMGGDDSKSTRTVTFGTDHLSAYSIAE